MHPISILDVYKVFEHNHMLWMGICVHPYIVIPVQGGGQIWKNWGEVEVEYKLRCHDVMVEPVSTSILDICEMFEHLIMLSLEIWAHPYTVTPAKVGPDLGLLGAGLVLSKNDAMMSWLSL
jgi:hypothetical protein